VEASAAQFLAIRGTLLHYRGTGKDEERDRHFHLAIREICVSHRKVESELRIPPISFPSFPPEVAWAWEPCGRPQRKWWKMPAVPLDGDCGIPKGDKGDGLMAIKMEIRVWGFFRHIPDHVCGRHLPARRSVPGWRHRNLAIVPALWRVYIDRT